MSVGRLRRRVLIVTGQHFANAPRKVDLHFMADSLIGRGDHVDFLVWRLSPVSRFLNDGRSAFARQQKLNRWQVLAPGLEQFIWYGLIHPMNLKLPILNGLADPLFSHFGAFLPAQVKARLPSYSHILIESGPSPLLTAALRAKAPQAKLIYHAADRLKTIGVPPAVERVMRNTLDLYDQIHVMAEALKADFPSNDKLLYLPHGIDRAMFDRAYENPYAGQKNAISVGDMLFDASAIEVMADAHQDWTFHLFGKKAQLSAARRNVIVHGEQPFEAIVPFIRFADVGIAPYRAGANADYLSQSSLKMIQYSYCQLPIVAPGFAAAGRGHVMRYDPMDAGSIRAAFARASVLDRAAIETDDILSWNEAVDVVFD
jgi:2-beta-glucuronyltransferase